LVSVGGSRRLRRILWSVVRILLAMAVRKLLWSAASRFSAALKELSEAVGSDAILDDKGVD
jgi:hypothetical protein